MLVHRCPSSGSELVELSAACPARCGFYPKLVDVLDVIFFSIPKLHIKMHASLSFFLFFFVFQ